MSDQKLGLDSDDIAAILNDTVFGDCILWYDVGLELGLKEGKLKEIQEDYRKTEVYKREMISLWLKTAENPNMKELHDAVNRVNKRHERERNRKKTTEDEKKALQATHRLIRLLEEWETVNQRLYSNQQELEHQLQEEKCWMQKTLLSKWKVEDNQWEHGDTATKRGDIIQALINAGGNYQNNTFVREFLQQKGISDTSIITDEVIVGMLRQALVDIEASRARELKERYRQTLAHQRRLTEANTEIKQLEKKIKERFVVYGHIKEGMDEIGAKQKKIETLNCQMKELSSKLKDCTNMMSDFEEAEHHLHNEILHVSSELNAVLASLDNTIRLMETDEDAFVSMLRAIWDGAVAGAKAGHEMVPVVGAVVGGVAGAALGGVKGILGIHKKSLDTHIQSYRETLMKGRDLHRELKDLMD